VHWLALVLAVLAALVLVVCHLDATRPRAAGARAAWATVPLGLILLTAAWCVQLIVVAGKHFTLR